MEEVQGESGVEGRQSVTTNAPTVKRISLRDITAEPPCLEAAECPSLAALANRLTGCSFALSPGVEEVAVEVEEGGEKFPTKILKISKSHRVKPTPC